MSGPNAVASNELLSYSFAYHAKHLLKFCFFSTFKTFQNVLHSDCCPSNTWSLLLCHYGFLWLSFFLFDTGSFTWIVGSEPVHLFCLKFASFKRPCQKPVFMFFSILYSKNCREDVSGQARLMTLHKMLHWGSLDVEFCRWQWNYLIFCYFKSVSNLKKMHV